MKLSYFQLEQHLEKKIAPIYVVSGDEYLQKQDARTLIRKKAKQAGYLEKISFTAEANNWDQLYGLLYATSLFAEKRFVELDFSHVLPNKAASALLKEYAAAPDPQTILLIHLGKLDTAATKSAWYQAISIVGMIIAVWPISRAELPRWLIQRAQQYKMQLEFDAAKMLAEQVEGNLLAASQAIEKLYLLRPQARIDRTLLASFLSDESQYSLFDLTDSLIAMDTARALQILAHLKQDGTEPILILWAIAREIRILIAVAQGLQQGTAYDVLCKSNGIFPKRQASVRQFLNKFTTSACTQLLTHAARLDKMVKGAQPGNVWHTLQLFCLRFQTS